MLASSRNRVPTSIMRPKVERASASWVTPRPIGGGGLAGMGGMPVVAGLGQGTLVGQLAVPPTWAGGQVTPLAGTSVTPLHTVGWTGAAPQAGAGTPMAGMPGM